MQLAKTDRNPIQEREYQQLLKQTGAPFELREGRAFVPGFGFGGNIAGEATEAFFGGGGGLQQQQGIQARETFFGKQRGEEQEFLGRFRTEFPQILTGIEEELGLPGLRGRARGLTDVLRETPERVEVGARGFDVTANQLARMVAAETGELSPEVSEAIRQAQFGEEEFGRRAARELAPFETEAQFMTDRLSREATGFGIEQQGRLNILLQKMQTEGTLAVAEMQEATKLAGLEQSKTEFEEGLTSIDLGDRVAFFDRTGNLVSSVPKGAAPKQAGGGGAGFVTTPPKLGTLQPTPGFIPIG